jgi:hypothetical protein
MTVDGLEIEPGAFLAVFTTSTEARVALVDPALSCLGLHLTEATGLWLITGKADWRSAADPAAALRAAVGQVERLGGSVLVTGSTN